MIKQEYCFNAPNAHLVAFVSFSDQLQVKASDSIVQQNKLLKKKRSTPTALIILKRDTMVVKY